MCFCQVAPGFCVFSVRKSEGTLLPAPCCGLRFLRKTRHANRPWRGPYSIRVPKTNSSWAIVGPFWFSLGVLSLFKPYYPYSPNGFCLKICQLKPLVVFGGERGGGSIFHLRRSSSMENDWGPGLIESGIFHGRLVCVCVLRFAMVFVSVQGFQYSLLRV